MSDRLSKQAAGIGALAEPVRRDLYLFVVGQAEAVSREQAAEGAGVPLHTAKFHLDRLVEEGLLDVEFRRLSGRTGPGAGRPSKLYRRSSLQLAVSLPDRRYDLAGGILAAGVERAGRSGLDVDEAVRLAARDEGRAIGAGWIATAGRGTASESERAAVVLSEHGYEPRSREEDIVLVNCPFDALAKEHTALVCGLNETFVGGVLEGLGCEGLTARLDPEDGLCCVKVRPAG
jgi:predicted ArsR family transcriptional regulator